MGRAVKVMVKIARVAPRCLPTLGIIFLVVTAGLVGAEEAVNPDGVAFGEAKPVSDESLAEVHGTGIAATNPLPREDIAVILWDEQPKVKPVEAPTEGRNSSPIQRTSIRVR